MHPYHKELLEEIQKKGGKPIHDPYWSNYLGTPHPIYKLKSADMRKLCRAWWSKHREITPDELALVIRSLVLSKNCTEIVMAGLLLDTSRQQHRTFDPMWLDKWLSHFIGWVEVDSLCTGNFPASEILRRWTSWVKLLNRLSRSNQIEKRRASLVLLCSPLRREKDPRLLQQAFKTVDRLSREKEILITKAVSWVLRSASSHFPREVKKYVTLNEAKLPRIAVRETLTKINTGTKTKRKPK